MVEDQQGTFSVDMTTAIELKPLDPARPYLFAISGWKQLMSSNNSRMVVAEFTVVRPEEKPYGGSKVFENIVVDNEYGLGRLVGLLIALGKPESEVRVKNFKVPSGEEMLGLQFTGWVRTRESEQYGDRSQLARIRPASTYSEVAQY